MKLSTVLALAAFNGAAAFVPVTAPGASTRLSMADVGGSVNDLATSAYGVAGSGPGSPLYKASGDVKSLAEIWDDSTPIICQGGSLRTWSYTNPAIETVQVLLKTEGRPLDADVELWQGPDNTPHKMRVYVEDGALRTFNAVIGTPRGPNTVSIRNIGQLEFPLDAVVRPDMDDGLAASIASVAQSSETIQGGALRTYPFHPTVESVGIILKTDGRPLNARIELLQGPNNNKQVIELYTEDGLDRPFFAIIETPGSGNVVRIVNTAPVEFPLYASVDSYMTGDGGSWGADGLIMGGGQW
jgi:hypothetical protein